MGHPWRWDLVHRRGFEFRRITRAYCRSGCVLFHWSGSNNDFSLLGRICLERIFHRARKVKTLLVWMFVLFICGLTAVALAPLF